MDKTPLYDEHLLLHAKMVDFNGWLMPLHYGSIVAEHRAVRTAAGLFDVSHMGLVEVSGPQTLASVDWLCTNDIGHAPDGKAVYTLFCDERGGCLDDGIVLRESAARCLIVVNASNRQKMADHMREQMADYAVTVKPLYHGYGIIALQGPEAPSVARRMALPDGLPPMTFVNAEWRGHRLLVAATGYTGEKGVELIAPQAALASLWREMIAAGVVPCGLGARDTLRLEKGYALYGHELSPQMYGCDTVSAWTIKWHKGPFLGRDALTAHRGAGERRYAVALSLEEGIAREGAAVMRDGVALGSVTSGTFSPSLQKGIALAMVVAPLAAGDHVEVSVRGRPIKAAVVSLPFYPPKGEA